MRLVMLWLSSYELSMHPSSSISPSPSARRSRTTFPSSFPHLHATSFRLSRSSAGGSVRMALTRIVIPSYGPIQCELSAEAALRLLAQRWRLIVAILAGWIPKLLSTMRDLLKRGLALGSTILLAPPFTSRLLKCQRAVSGSARE